MTALNVKVYSNGAQLKDMELISLVCGSCKGLLQHPVQVTACGDRFCQSCIDKLMRNNKAPYSCPVDGTEFLANEVRKDKGCLKELQRLEIECTTKPTPCGWRGPLTNLESHLSECPTVEVRCTLGCGEHVLKSQLSSHVSSQCPNRPSVCQHTVLGLEANAVQNTQCHGVKSEAVCSRIMKIPGQCSPSMRRSFDEVLQLQKQIERICSRCGQLQNCIGQTNAKLQSISQEIESHAAELMKVTENIETVQQCLTQHAVVIDEVRLRQDILDVKTTNGVFIWKIPDIRRRYRDALDGRTISLYSPPFYTSPHGYRMCVRTYLNGDGIGKGTHMSVFFVLMRSEHDSLLAYPFKQSVRFTLINQSNPSASVTEAFIPDLTSPSFQRPEKDMNVASGFPKFARLSVLYDDTFTKNDTIFIKCQVDLTGLSSQ